MTWAIAVTHKTWYRIICIIVLAVCFISLVPAGMVFGDELGGYVTEKLIGAGGAYSRLVIGGTEGSFLDIGTELDGFRGPEAVVSLNRLIPLILMAMVVFMMLRAMAHGQVNILTLLLVAILLYVFYALLPGIQETITSLFGGP